MLDFLYYVIEGIGWTLAPKPPGIFALDLLRQRPAWAGVGCPQAATPAVYRGCIGARARWKGPAVQTVC